MLIIAVNRLLIMHHVILNIIMIPTDRSQYLYLLKILPKSQKKVKLVTRQTLKSLLTWEEVFSEGQVYCWATRKPIQLWGLESYQLGLPPPAYTSASCHNRPIWACIPPTSWPLFESRFFWTIDCKICKWPR